MNDGHIFLSYFNIVDYPLFNQPPNYNSIEISLGECSNLLQREKRCFEWATPTVNFDTFSRSNLFQTSMAQERWEELFHNLKILTARKVDCKAKFTFNQYFISPFLCSLKKTQLYFFFPSFICLKFENKNIINQNYGSLHFSWWFTFFLTTPVSPTSN